MKPWNVARTWWELTKLVIAGRGGYEMNAVFNFGDDDADPWAHRRVWMPYHLGWVAGEGRYATLCFDAPEDGMA